MKTARLVACMWIVFAGVASAVTVTEVRIEKEGAGFFDEEFVRAHIGVKAGQDFDRTSTSRDIRNLLKTGRFSNVNSRIAQVEDGYVLTYIVHNRYVVNKVNVVRAGRRRTPGKLLSLIDLKSGDFIDRELLDVRLQRVRADYEEKYRPDTEVIGVLRVVDVDAGRVDIDVEVREGEKMAVKKIAVEVADASRDKPGSRLPRDVASKLAGRGRWWNPFNVFKKSPLDDYAIESMADRVRREYLNRGYLDVDVGEPEIRHVRRGRYDAVIPVTVGDLYRLGDVEIKGVTLFPEGEIESQLRLQPGDIASLSEIDDAAARVREYYGNRGYVQTSVDGRRIPHDDLLDVSMTVKEGSLVRLRNIHIRGNSVTKDKVMRRELRVFPGDVFNEFRVRSSRNRLLNLGHFSDVSYFVEKTLDPDERDLVFEVQEQETGQLMLGVGFSSVENVLGFVELSQGNFDLTGWPLTGGGQKIKVRAQLGSERQDFEVNFAEPWFLDRRLSLGLDAFARERSFLSNQYDQRDTGGAISLGRPIPFVFDRATLRYSLTQIEIDDVSEDASDVIKEEAGSRTQSRLGLTLVRDRRDRVRLPTRGYRTSVGGDFSGGPLGADTELYGAFVRTSHYFPLWFRHVLNVRGWAEVVDFYDDTDRVPISDRLFLGGPRTLRGYGFRDAGPRDENDEPIGGRSGVMANVEYFIPLVEDDIRFAAYADAGTIGTDSFDIDTDNMFVSAGVGVQFNIPGFPIRLDYAWPLENGYDIEKGSGRFHFSLGFPN